MTDASEREHAELAIEARFEGFLNSLRVGLFLALRQMKANMGTTILISIVMMLVFLNLMLLNGMLVGIVDGVRNERKQYYTSDLILSNLREKNYIENSAGIVERLRRDPALKAVSPRYLAFGHVEANYVGKDVLDNPEQVDAFLIGIDPAAEDDTTRLSDLVSEGKYLQKDDYDRVLIGKGLVKKYLPVEMPGFFPLNVGAGDKIRVTLPNGQSREVTVKGIINSKIEDINRKIYFLDWQLRDMLSRSDYNVNEIAVKTSGPQDAARIKKELLASGVGAEAKVQLPAESEPKFINDFRDMFNLLGAILGNIGLVVAFITTFILVFINTITRRKFLGILHAIGIDATAIESAYVIQSLFYAFFGIIMGTLILIFLLEPYFAENPVNYPLSNGILSVSPSGLVIEAFVLLIAVIVAAMVPARMVMHQRIVDAILGR